MAEKLRIQYRKVDSLAPYARNSRTHSPDQVAQIAASIREFGFTNPVLIDEAGTIIAGHGRVLAARECGLEAVPCVTLAGLTEAQRRAYVIADNRIAESGEWDADLLRGELEAIRADFDLGLVGFADFDFGQAPPAGPAGPDPEPPAVQAFPVTIRGETWMLGPHRIKCGDCRAAEDVEGLLAGAQINLAFTSPPYADRREYDAASGFRPINPDDYVEWFAPVAANVHRHLAADGSWFVNIKPSSEGLDTDLYVFDLVIAHVRAWGWHFATEFCWERVGVPKSVTQRFKNQFEPIYQFAKGRWKMRPDDVRHPSDSVPVPGGPGVGDTSWATAQGGNAPIFGGQRARKSNLRDKAGNSVGMDEKGQGRDPATYGEAMIGEGMAYPGNRLPTFAGSHKATGHAAAFPVGLPEFFAKAYADPGDVVFDPFTGSGSTIIAAHKTGRRGLGMELSPLYVDLSVRRWQEFTGEKAILDGDGRTFDEVAAERVKVAA